MKKDNANVHARANALDQFLFISVVHVSDFLLKKCDALVNATLMIQNVDSILSKAATKLSIWTCISGWIADTAGLTGHVSVLECASLTSPATLRIKKGHFKNYGRNQSTENHTELEFLGELHTLQVWLAMSVFSKVHTWQVQTSCE